MEEARHTLFYHFTQPFRTPLYVVAYDIQDDKRRTKVHKVLQGFGERTEFSLFECFLTKKELLQMRAKLDKHLDARTDRVRIYTICDACVPKIETVGIPEPVEENSYLVILYPSLRVEFPIGKKECAKK